MDQQPAAKSSCILVVGPYRLGPCHQIIRRTTYTHGLDTQPGPFGGQSNFQPSASDSSSAQLGFEETHEQLIQRTKAKTSLTHRPFLLCLSSPESHQFRISTSSPTPHLGPILSSKRRERNVLITLKGSSDLRRRSRFPTNNLLSQLTNQTHTPTTFFSGLVSTNTSSPCTSSQFNTTHPKRPRHWLKKVRSRSALASTPPSLSRRFSPFALFHLFALFHFPPSRSTTPDSRAR